MRPVILIPARLVSTRFPEKMLHKLDGVPLIKRVYDACEDMDIPTYVLTDSMKVAQASGAAALLTPECESGTDRCCYWANTNALATKYDVVVNVQGDLPDIRKEHVEAVLEGLTTDRVSTLYADIDDSDRDNPSFVKIVHNKKRAKWFGRGITGYGHHHIGVYGYHMNELRQYRNLKKFECEDLEKLEQLRWIMNGVDIGIRKVKYHGCEINTPEDAIRWNVERENPLVNMTRY